MEWRRPDARTTLDTCTLGCIILLLYHNCYRRCYCCYCSDNNNTINNNCIILLSECQPTKADSQCGHYWTTLTTPLHGPHCRTPVPGPSPVTLPDRTGAIHIIHQRCCTLLCPFPANPLSKAVPPTWISTTTPGRRRLSLLL